MKTTDFDNIEAILSRYEATPEQEAEAQEAEKTRELQRIEDEAKKQQALFRYRLKSIGFGLREIKVIETEKIAKVAEIEAALKNHGIALIHGDCGTGKTVAACAVASRHKGSVVYKRYPDFIMELKDTWRKDSVMSEKQYIDELKKVNLLIFDEIQDRGKDKEWEDVLLTSIIDYRYSHFLSTIFITNLDIKTFSSLLTRSVFSRCQQAGKSIKLDNESFRKLSKTNK